MLRQLKNNEQGIVFITIVIILMVTMLLAVSIISMNVSQAMITEKEVKRIQAELLGQGAMARLFMNQLTSSPGLDINGIEVLGNTTFTYNAIRDPSGTGIDGTDTLDITITY